MTAPAAHPSSEGRAPFGAGALSPDQPTVVSAATLRSAGREPSAEQSIVDPSAKAETAAPHLLAVPDLSGFHELRIWAESFEDTQRARIACENRMLRGGVAPDLFVGQIEALKAAEHQVKLGLVRCYRRVTPTGIQAWAKSQFGIGKTSPHMLARLLGALGHPRIATPYHWEGEGADRKLVADLVFERSVRQLWSYCGHGDADRKKRKGMSADEAFALGNPRCKMLVHLLAEATMKCRVEPTHGADANEGTADPTTSPEQPSGGSSAKGTPAARDTSTEPTEEPIASAFPAPSAGQPTSSAKASVEPADRRYRVIYDQARLRYAEHDDWSDGHKHNAALRLVAKEILRDLWTASA